MIKCQHCGTRARTFRHLGWGWNPRAGRPEVVQPATAQYNRLDVVAEASADYAETITVGVAMEVCGHPAQHPHIVVTGASDGRPREFRGRLAQTFTVGYRNWFAAAAAQAKAAIRVWDIRSRKPWSAITESAR